MTAEWFPSHLAGLRAATAAKRDSLCGALSAVFGPRIEFVTPSGGMFVWARLTDGTDTTDLLPRALDHGVAFVPGPTFAVERDLRSHLRLSWATASAGGLVEAVERLDAATAADA